MTNKKVIVVVFSFLFFNSGFVFSQTGDIPQELVHYPEYVFYNGQVLTADSDTPDLPRQLPCEATEFLR